MKLIPRPAVSFVIIVRATARAIEFVGWVVMARSLGAADFGSLWAGFLICRYLGIIADWGASTRGSRDVVKHGVDRIYGMVSHRRAVTAVLFGVFVAGTFITGHSEVAPISGVLIALGLNRDWISLGLGRTLRSSYPLLVQGLVFAALSFFADSLWFAAVVVAAAYSAGLVTSMALNPVRGSKEQESDVSVDGWMMAGVFADQISTSLDMLLLASLRTVREAGIYAAVYRIPNTWVFLLQSYVTIIIPDVTREFLSDRTHYLGILKSSFKKGLALSLIPLSGIPLISSVLPRIFGVDFAEGSTPGIILLGSTAVWTLMAPSLPLYLAISKERVVSKIVILTAALNGIINLAVIPRWGMTGAAFVMLFTQSITCIALFSYLLTFGKHLKGESVGE